MNFGEVALSMPAEALRLAKMDVAVGRAMAPEYGRATKAQAAREKHVIERSS